MVSETYEELAMQFIVFLFLHIGLMKVIKFSSVFVPVIRFSGPLLFLNGVWRVFWNVGM